MVTGGFFNSVNDDRLYYADQVNNFFEGLVGAGVFESVDGGLQVKAGAGMQVQVAAGRLVDSKGRWLRNDAVLNLTIDPADVTLSRYDSIIAAIDSSMEKRTAEIYVKKGVAAASPSKPSIVRNTYLEEYCLAYVYVNKGVTSISQSAISDTRPDNSICGFVTGLIDQLNTSELFIQYQTAFDEWFNAVKDTLNPTIIRQYTSSYTTTEEEESVIPINISQYNKAIDILDVYINGMKLVQDVDYTNSNNTHITLTKPLCAGAVVEFEVFKSAEGSNDESMEELVNQLQTDLNATKTDLNSTKGVLNTTKITANDGSPKVSLPNNSTTPATLEFINLGLGFHTLSAYEKFRTSPNELIVSTEHCNYFGHVTETGSGYLFAIKDNGSVLVRNTITGGGSWSNWRTLFDSYPVLLYQNTQSASPLEITPTKSLMDCQHGWILTFSGASSVNDYVQTVCIPKKSFKNTQWNGENMTFPLVYAYNENTGSISQCVKKFSVYNTKLVGADSNNQGNSNNMILRSVQEY